MLDFRACLGLGRVDEAAVVLGCAGYGKWSACYGK